MTLRALWVSLFCLAFSAGLILYAQQFNGRGPDAGVWGLLLTVVGIILFLVSGGATLVLLILRALEPPTYGD